MLPTATSTTKEAHTTKTKHYITVIADDGTYFHRYNMQVSDYYFQIKYNENDPDDKGTIDLNFRAAVQGNSKVADTITSLELSSSTAGQTEEKTSASSALADLKTALSAGNPYYYRSHFIFLTNPYTAQYALKVSLDFDLGSGQTATASSTKDRTLRDILSYFYKIATTEQQITINEFLSRNNLQILP